MKKIKVNWTMIGMVLIILAMTFMGVELMEEEWIETASAAIWIAGMVMVTITMVVEVVMNNLRDLVKMEKYYNKESR